MASPTNPDEDVSIEREYNSDGLVTKLTAKNSTTGDQVTKYVYGTDVGGITPEVYRNDLLRAVIYPDSSNTPTQVENGTTDGYDRVEYRYNRQGGRIELKDQNETLHQYTLDKLGRLTADTVTTVGTGVDDAVRRIDRAYEIRGLLEKVTSYSDTAGTTELNRIPNRIPGTHYQLW